MGVDGSEWEAGECESHCILMSLSGKGVRGRAEMLMRTEVVGDLVALRHRACSMAKRGLCAPPLLQAHRWRAAS